MPNFTSNSKVNNLTVSGTLLIAAGIYYLDLITPLGTADGALYFLPLLFSYWARRRSYPYVFAAVCTVLTTAGLFYSEPGGIPMHVSFLNRLLSVGVLWTTARLLVLHRQNEDAVHDMTTRLRRLAARSEQTREDERKRIAREIHDELGQALTGLKLELVWLQNQMLKEPSTPADLEFIEKTRTMAGQVDGLVKMVRELCTDLRPAILDDLGLVAAIEWQTREFQRRTGIRATLALHAKELKLTPERSTAIFRTYQETLTNIVRHANASNVDVAFTANHREVTLEVKDNGKGIEEDQINRATSLGLLGMRERTMLLNGTLHIKGEPGRGTTVTVSVPIADTVRRQEQDSNHSP